MAFWRSLRGRFLTAALVLGIALFGIAVHTDRLLTRTAAQDHALAQQTRSLRSALDEAVWSLQRTEASLYLYVLDPVDDAGKIIWERLDRAKAALDSLVAAVADGRLPGLAKEAYAAVAELRGLRRGAERIVALGADVEARFPAMPLVRSELYPSSQLFLQALDSVLYGEESDDGREAHDLLIQLRHLWTRQLMETRLFFANRFGVYGAPEESMERNLHDRAIYVEQIGHALKRLTRKDEEGSLSFERSAALAQMVEAADRYERLFRRAADIYQSAGWRQDLPLMRHFVEPALIGIWQRMKRMSVQLDERLESGLMSGAVRARFLGYALWTVSGVSYLLILAGYFFFERAIRRPLYRVAQAMEAEGRGEPHRSLPSDGAREVILLHAAFDGMRRQVRSRQVRLESILRHARDGILTFSEEGRIHSFNKAAERLFGYSSQQVAGLPIASLLPQFDLTRISALAEQASDTEPDLEPVVAAQRSDGTTFRMSLKLSALEVDGERLYTALVADVTDREELLERLRRMATFDPLTGLYNRRFFMEELGRVLDRAPRGRTQYALLYIDLDNFKFVNDTLGHLVGDRVLVEVTALLKDRLRSGDILARLGGDEFAVLLYEADGSVAPSAAERFREALSDYRLRQEGQIVDVGCSIGIAALSDEVGSREELLARADLACHIAKQQGRNRCHLYRPEDRESQATMSLDMGWSARLKQALQCDGFVMARQPVVALVDGHVVAHEVLLRLPRPGGGLILPAGFLPSAARFGLSSEIDAWVVRHVITELAEHGGGPYTVNLSGRSLGDHQVLKTITHDLDRSGIDPALLRFEVSEPDAVRDLDAASEFFGFVRKLGCGTALDNFGIGHGSFRYLRELPVDYVKIDGSLIRSVVDDPVSRTMVSAFNDVAHALGKRTAAEQVEDEQTRLLLRELGFDCAQGWCIQEPEVFWRGPETGSDRAQEG